MKIAFAVFVFIHAFAHLVGVVSVSGIARVEGASQTPTLLLTNLDPGHWAVKVLAALWLAAAAGFVASGVGLLQETSWAAPLLVTTTAVSAVLCLLWVKEAPLGLVANAMIIAAVVIPALADRVLPSTGLSGA